MLLNIIGFKHNTIVNIQVRRSQGMFAQEIFSPADIASLRDFEIIGWEVDSDVEFSMKIDNSWNPSNVSIFSFVSLSTSFYNDIKPLHIDSTSMRQIYQMPLKFIAKLYIHIDNTFPCILGCNIKKSMLETMVFAA